MAAEQRPAPAAISAVAGSPAALPGGGFGGMGGFGGGPNVERRIDEMQRALEQLTRELAEMRRAMQDQRGNSRGRGESRPTAGAVTAPAAPSAPTPPRVGPSRHPLPGHKQIWAKSKVGGGNSGSAAFFAFITRSVEQSARRQTQVLSCFSGARPLTTPPDNRYDCRTSIHSG